MGKVPYFKAGEARLTRLWLAYGPAGRGGKGRVNGKEIERYLRVGGSSEPNLQLAEGGPRGGVFE